MTSNSKVGLGYEIQSNNEVLSYEEEMNHTVFKCTEEDFLNKPLYSRFSKTNKFKGDPHPLTGDYTPKPQEEIDDSLYVYGKKGPQKPEISDSVDTSTEHSTCQSNDSEGSFGNPSSESESESISVPTEMSTSKSVTTNEKVVSESKEVEPSCATHVKTPRQPMKIQETPKVNRKNWNEMMERELGEARMTYSHAVKGNWSTAVKTSAGYNWRGTRPNSNYNSGSNFVRTVNVKGPQGRPKPKKAWGQMTGKRITWQICKNANGDLLPLEVAIGYITGYKCWIRSWMFDIDYLTDSMNYIPVSLENQTNPHAGTSEVTNSAGTLPTPNANASEEEDAAEELIVVPTAVKHTAAKVGPRMSSTNSKAEEFLTELQNLTFINTKRMKIIYPGIFRSCTNPVSPIVLKF
ncbi:hypothetical protein Tco_0532485 [Tanacetum coccineum]